MSTYSICIYGEPGKITCIPELSSNTPILNKSSDCSKIQTSPFNSSCSKLTMSLFN